MTPPAVTVGAMATCSFGVAPSSLVALPTPRVMVEGKPVLRMTDIVPGMNIPPFGMCTTPSNPTVAAATVAALGVLTPMPCVPVPAGPWKPPAATTIVGGVPAIHSGSTCQCAWGGVITIGFPGTVRTQVN